MSAASAGGLRERRVEIGAVSLCVSECEGPGRPFVVLQGLTGHRHDFAACLPRMAGDAWWVAPDLRGHGDFTRTDDASSFRFAQLVDDLARLLDALGADHCDLLGHSFGGMVALRFALAHPDRLGRFVLMSTAAQAPSNYTAETFRKSGDFALEHGMDRLCEIVEKQIRADPATAHAPMQRWADVYWDHLRMRYAAMDPLGYRELGVLMCEEPLALQTLGAIEKPTLVLIGDRDDEFMPGSRALAEAIPGARLEVLPGAGHHPHRETPELWLAAMRAEVAQR